MRLQSTGFEPVPQQQQQQQQHSTSYCTNRRAQHSPPHPCCFTAVLATVWCKKRAAVAVQGHLQNQTACRPFTRQHCLLRHTALSTQHKEAHARTSPGHKIARQAGAIFHTPNLPHTVRSLAAATGPKPWPDYPQNRLCQTPPGGAVNYNTHQGIAPTARV